MITEQMKVAINIQYESNDVDDAFYMTQDWLWAMFKAGILPNEEYRELVKYNHEKNRDLGGEATEDDEDEED